MSLIDNIEDILREINPNLDLIHHLSQSDLIMLSLDSTLFIYTSESNTTQIISPLSQTLPHTPNQWHELTQFTPKLETKSPIEYALFPYYTSHTLTLSDQNTPAIIGLFSKEPLTPAVKQRLKLQLTHFQTQLRKRQTHSNTSKQEYFGNVLLSILAHDLRSPMASLHMLTQMIQDQEIFEQFDETITTHFTQLSYRLERTLAFMDRVFVWGGIQSGQIIPKVTSISLFDFIQELESHIKSLLIEKHIVFQNAVPIKTQIESDPHILSLVLNSLFTNALKYTKKGIVEIASQTDKKNISLFITNSEANIPEHILAKIQAGLKTNTLGTSGEQGHGIGLILCQGFLKKINGHLTVQNIKNKGVQVTLTLPLSLSQVETPS